MIFSCLIEFFWVFVVLVNGVRGAVEPGDWKVREWDVIVVGAGPAGIIGEYCTLFCCLTDFS